jgi:hypothetical protein
MFALASETPLFRFEYARPALDPLFALPPTFGRRRAETARLGETTFCGFCFLKNSDPQSGEQPAGGSTAVPLGALFSFVRFSTLLDPLAPSDPLVHFRRRRVPVFCCFAEGRAEVRIGSRDTIAQVRARQARSGPAVRAATDKRPAESRNSIRYQIRAVTIVGTFSGAASNRRHAA